MAGRARRGIVAEVTAGGQPAVLGARGLLEDRDRVFQREPDARLCRNFDVLLARGGRRTRPGARADARADRRTPAAAGDPANQRADARSAGDRGGVALLMACAGPHVDRRLDWMPLTLH